MSGRFDSAVKYLMVCGLPSSAMSKSFLVRLGISGAVLVFHVEEQLHDIDVDFQSLGGLLRVVGFLVLAPSGALALAGLAGC